MIALGVDAATGDRDSPLRVTADGFRAGGHALVQEGGYDVATLESVDGAAHRAACHAVS